MMNDAIKQARVFLSLIALLSVPAITLAAADNSEKLVDDSAATKSAMTDLQAAQKELTPLLDQGKVFGDDAKRAETAPKVLPLLRRIVAAFDTLRMHVVRTAGGGEYKFQPLAMLAYFGDEKTAAQLKEDAAGKDQAAAIEAGAALAISDWWKAAHDAAAQTKVIQSVKALAHDHPGDDQITIALLMMGNTTPASPALRDEAMKVISDDLKGPLAQRVGASIAAEQKLKALEGKPLVISGVALEVRNFTTDHGKIFTTADWKGKVILVDFWASWCGPCKAELPRVKKAYADYHAKGLEVLGVSCDQGAGPLHAFLDKNPDMPWPELFDEAHPGWHEIATGFGINGIPTMFLIDKAGVVRSVTARKDFEEQIPKMLDEK